MVTILGRVLVLIVVVSGELALILANWKHMIP